MKRYLVGVIVMALVVGGLFAFLSRNSGDDSAAVDTSPGNVAPVRAPNTVIADARVVPLRSASLSVSTSGVVTEIAVREGQRVEAGQVLLRLDSARHRAAVAQQEAQLQRAEAYLAQVQRGARPQEIEVARAAVDAAQAQLSRVRVGAAPVEATLAQAELRRVEAQLDMLLAGERPENVQAAAADVASARAALAQAEVALAETELRAPFAGVIASIQPNVGEFVAPGTPVVWLADDDEWRIETADLTELGVVRIREGSAVRVSIDALPELDLAGVVEHIKPLGENRLGDITYKALIVLDAQDERMRWNMTASVQIEGRD